MILSGPDYKYRCRVETENYVSVCDKYISPNLFSQTQLIYSVNVTHLTFKRDKKIALFL